jgi:hypothetical protein
LTSLTFEGAKAAIPFQEIVPPGPIAQSKIELHRGKRWMNLSELKVINRICKWCETGQIADARRHYCSPKCQDSADLWCRPQSPAAKAFVLVFKQDGCCTFCGLSWEDELCKRIDESRRRYSPDPTGRTLLWRIGYGTGDLWHVDHVIPIHKGGNGVGLDNVQVICVKCHFRKTAKDNSRSK